MRPEHLLMFTKSLTSTGPSVAPWFPALSATKDQEIAGGSRIKTRKKMKEVELLD